MLWAVLLRWVGQADIDAGTRLGVASDAAAGIKRLRRENAELWRVNEIAGDRVGVFLSRSQAGP